MHEVIKPGIALFIITCIAAILLGAVQYITAEPIRIQQEETKNAAMREILPLALDFEDTPLPAESENITALFTAYLDGELNGYVFAVNTVGYAGTMSMLVALDPEGNIAGVSILTHSETPGLGANATDEEFRNQYIGFFNEVFVTKMPPGDHEVQAITSSTITTVAVTDAVNEVTEYFQTNMN